jgi:hypothetical protein
VIDFTDLTPTAAQISAVFQYISTSGVARMALTYILKVIDMHHEEHAIM